MPCTGTKYKLRAEQRLEWSGLHGEDVTTAERCWQDRFASIGYGGEAGRHIVGSIGLGSVFYDLACLSIIILH